MKFFGLLSILFFCSCSSYNLTRRVNPFKKYGVKSVSIPMFYNQSTLGHISHYFTKEFTQLLYEVKELEVKNANDESVDAFLVGVIRGDYSKTATLAPDNLVLLKRVAPNRVTENGVTRNGQVPNESKLNLSLDIYLVRKNKRSEAEVYNLRRKNFPNLAKDNDSIIFHEKIPVVTRIEREIFDDENAVVNSSQNRGILNKVIKKQAKVAATNFKNIIFYAF